MIKFKLGDIDILVEQKNIKKLYLKVLPPHGNVKISAPQRMDIDTIRVFALSNLQWIKEKQLKFTNQVNEPKQKYLDLEVHYFCGKKYLLRIHEVNSAPKVTFDHDYIHLFIRPNTPTDKCAKIVDEWYRAELKKIVPELISKWEKVIGVQSNEFGIKKMRTKWGTCNTVAKRIWLNLELAKKPKECLEYVIVHELVHLLERSHNKRFVAFMDKFMPKWRVYQEELNCFPYGYLD